MFWNLLTQWQTHYYHSIVVQGFEELQRFTRKHTHAHTMIHSLT